MYPLAFPSAFYVNGGRGGWSRRNSLSVSWRSLHLGGLWSPGLPRLGAPRPGHPAWLCFQPAGAHSPPSPFLAESLGMANGWGCRDLAPAPAGSSVASSGQPAHVSRRGPGEGTPGREHSGTWMDGVCLWGRRLLLEVRAGLAGFRPGWADPASLDTRAPITRETWRWAGCQEGALSPGGTPRG